MWRVQLPNTNPTDILNYWAVRARRKKGMHIYRLKLTDRCVESLVTLAVATQRLNESEAVDHPCIETMLAHLLQEQGERWTR